jgi:hypothetical protein
MLKDPNYLLIFTGNFQILIQSQNLCCLNLLNLTIL